VRIVAMGGGGFQMDDPALDRAVLDIVGLRRPRVCLIPTATADDRATEERFRTAFDNCDTSVLRLFDREVADIERLLVAQDLVYVTGGNTVNLLAVWRAHGVDEALRAAGEAGVVLAGMSAGANCWFEACTTDSFLLGNADPLLDGLGFVPGSFTPHYDGEPARRPAVHALVGGGALPPGWACDDHAALYLVDGDVRAALASKPSATAYRVEPDGHGGVVETPIPAARAEMTR
jgi:dipeptidase E